MNQIKPKIAVHKFTSCDGCQLAFINAGESLFILSELVDIIHFVEAGMVNPNAKVDIAFIEGSISTPEEKRRIKEIRENSQYVITIGVCATTGGIQALRNFSDVDVDEWVQQIYPSPKHIKTLETSTAISHHISVDFELWGCPVNTYQVMTAIRTLLFGVTPMVTRDSVCIECKRNENVCVMVVSGEPCLGPVTQTGCGALCPAVGRGCYGCYGPKECPNPKSLGEWFASLGLSDDEIVRKFRHITNQADEFKEAAEYFKSKKSR